MDLSVVNHEDYFAKIGDDHKFPINKFGELANYLIKKKIVEKFHKPYACSEETLKRVHSENYIKHIKEKTLDQNVIKKIGFPLIDSVVRRSLVATGGTVLAAKLAIKNGVACNTAGGSHHANFDGGAGYCVFNDVAVAAQYLLDRGLAGRILIIDLDVHQGNGTAEIFGGDDSVFTFSMHGEKNYPFKKEKSDVDIGLANETKDEEYLKILKETLPQLIEEVKPDFVFYLSGVDVLETDQLGKLSLSIKACKERDRFVLQSLKDKNLPVECSMGGGYSKEIKHIVEAHANTYRLAQEIFY